jgi:hypothetical protein
VGGGEGGFESKGEGSWFRGRDLSGWEFTTMSKTLVTTKGKPKDNMGRLPWMLMLLGVISGQ